MIPRLLAILGLLILPTVSLAQEPATAQPKAMFAYLTIGMHVGIKSVDGTASVLIFVFTDDDYATVLATSKLAKNYPIAKDAAKTNAAIQRELDAFMSNRGSANTSLEHVRIMPPLRTAFGTLAAIGDDYVMIELDGDIKVEPDATSKRRRIIPKSFIGSIDLDAKPVHFIDTTPHSRSQSGG
ncbi:hypothetical protein [Aporhodopirellula aestuarii]|uniref:Chalcone isomerase domain-containing protein n=1 Tax=Aporhodopirellula aestuarii TaxID=2950107 RepID=A0ABT0UEE1_9BACT|nr:hypothetical protein [Aporhodopirellula aestuarii]MCM2375258.1 hypothetical protein [Aporhodopirellula aestuarii]